MTLRCRQDHCALDSLSVHCVFSRKLLPGNYIQLFFSVSRNRPSLTSLKKVIFYWPGLRSQLSPAPFWWEKEKVPPAKQSRNCPLPKRRMRLSPEFRFPPILFFRHFVLSLFRDSYWIRLAFSRFVLVFALISVWKIVAKANRRKTPNSLWWRGRGIV